MSWRMFDDLVEELRIPLTILFVQSMRSTSGNKPIYPEVIVAIGLRVLGPSYTFESCADNYSLSVPLVRQVFDLFLNAINFNKMCHAMRMKLGGFAGSANKMVSVRGGVLLAPALKLLDHVVQ